jgi:hypothetical protein
MHTDAVMEKYIAPVNGILIVQTIINIIGNNSMQQQDMVKSKVRLVVSN